MSENTEIPEELPEILVRMFKTQNRINKMLFDRIEALETEVIGMSHQVVELTSTR